MIDPLGPPLGSEVHTLFELKLNVQHFIFTIIPLPGFTYLLEMLLYMW